jgi:hypothetical protein
MCGTVLRGHQRQVQHLAAGELGAHREARTAALLGVDVVLRHRERLVQRQLASVTTSAVISLVIEAIGSTAWDSC